MKRGLLILFVIKLLILASCGSSSYPCPTLSTSGDQANAGVLTKRTVATDKKGLVKKKAVKKKKRR